MSEIDKRIKEKIRQKISSYFINDYGHDRPISLQCYFSKEDKLLNDIMIIIKEKS